MQQLVAALLAVLREKVRHDRVLLRALEQRRGVRLVQARAALALGGRQAVGLSRAADAAA